MELNDALRRIVGQHWRLLACFLVSGVALGGLLFAPGGKEYSASARLVLDTPDPVARAQSEAISDTAKAIATSSSLVSDALRQAGVQRGDPAAFAMNHVSVRALGSSGVLELSVTDPNRTVAAAIANALAARLIRTRLAVTNGQTDRVFADIDSRTAALSKKITTIEDYVNALTVQIANTAAVTEANRLRGKRNGAQTSVDFLIQQRGVLESERVSLLSTSAQRPRPSIISSATPPVKPEATHKVVYLVLGAILGLILGMGIAGVMETIRPTLVGGDTLALELNAPLLGGMTPDATVAIATDVGARLRMAAEAAGVRNVSVVATGSAVDAASVAAALGSSTAEAAQPANQNGNHGLRGLPQALRIAPFQAKNPPFNNGSRSGLVLVTPTALKKADLTDVGHLLKASNLPLLGVITYTSPDPGILADVKSRIDVVRRAVTR